jgi:hypothetical protein
MPPAVAERPVNSPGMAAKKKTSGKHTTSRINVGVPADWHAVLRKLAAKRQQPAIYTMIALLKAEAEKQGVGDLPLVPWEADAAD